MTTFKSAWRTAQGRRVTLNSLWLLLGRVLSQGLAFLFTVLVARYLGEAVLGQYAFIASVVLIANVVTTFGMDTLLIRAVAVTGERAAEQEKLEGTLTAALVIQVVLAIAIILFIWIGAGWLPNQTAETLLPLRLASLSLLPLGFSTVYSAYMRGRERMELYLFFTLISALWMAVGAILVIGSSQTLLALALLLLTSHLATAGTAAILCHRFLSPLAFRRAAVQMRTIIPVLKTGAILGGIVTLAVVYQRSGVLALSLLVGDSATGWYSAAARPLEALKLIPYALFGAMFPIMTRRTNLYSPLFTHQSPVSQSPNLYHTAFLALLLFAGCASLLLAMFARPLITLLYGPMYEPAAEALRILAWSLIPAVLVLRLSFDLVTSGQERTALKATAVTLIITLALVWLLTRQYGLLGTCAAVVGCECLQALIFYLFARYRA